VRHVGFAGGLEGGLEALLGLVEPAGGDEGLAARGFHPHRLDGLVGSFEELFDLVGVFEDGLMVALELGYVGAHSAFSELLNDRSLTPPQIRFVETVIGQLTARGVMEASALYEPPFSNLHAGGPDALFGGKENVIEGIFKRLKDVNSGLITKIG
jgi:hypothetical protein